MSVNDLPIHAALPELRAALSRHPCVLLDAPPGAGKSTQVPLALLDVPWLDGQRIVMLEPRRLAARMVARRLAENIGEAVGVTVGYRIRQESCVGQATRIEVVTEGILTRLIQSDPALTGIGLVIFDEYHERSLHADLGLALAREVQQALRPELRLLIMSATLEDTRLARLLDDAPIVRSDGRQHPVEIRYAPRLRELPLEQAVVSAVRRAVKETEGDLLVFLPGTGEIRRCEMLLAHYPALCLAPLHGDLDSAAQQRALAPAPGGLRKVILATTIAQTSLTIEGVRVVIDAGLTRAPRFDPAAGMSRLVTIAASQAAGTQRAGRAGRTAPGVCYRLWSEHEQRGRAPQDAPEIHNADLAPLALELALWGARDPAALTWLDAPPAAGYAQARDLLTLLGALDAQGSLTDHGRAMARLGTHPRLAHLLIAGNNEGHCALAAALAALLEERDPLRGEAARNADLRLRLEALRRVKDAAFTHLRDRARHFRARIGCADAGFTDANCGALLSLAYPDRIAQRRSGAIGKFRLSNGRGAWLPEDDALAGADWLAVAELDGTAREARIRLAAPLDLAAIEQHCAAGIRQIEALRWDAREEAVIARRERRIGELLLDSTAPERPDPEAMRTALIEGVRQMGLAALPWNDAVQTLRARVAFLRARDACWPDLGDAHLLATLAEWLAPWLDGMSRRSHLARLDLHAILFALLDHSQRRALDTLAPTHLGVPSGSRIALDYGSDPPVLAVRLQELFGLADTPHIAGGNVPVMLHLLSPAGRPVQVTRDLAGFWKSAYFEVRKDLKGRYPRHPWPDDPLAAPATRGAKRRPPAS
jgi:ATP-dependent helicase HrpB